MSTSATTQVHDLSSIEFISEKYNNNVANTTLDLQAPPHVVVRARSTNEGIEMSVFGPSRNTNEEFPDDGSISESKDSSRKEWAAVVACGCAYFCGWNDGSVGPLIPTIQKHYDLTFTVVSVLFVSGCLGFMLSGILNVYLSDRLGFGRIAIGGVCQAVSYAILVPALPFPVAAIAFLINEFGIGLQDAQANGFVSALRSNPSAKLGIIHSLYGAGAFISPFVATQFANKSYWSYLYAVPLVIASFNLLLMFTTFGFHTQEELLGPIQPPEPTESGSNQRKYKQVFGSWTVNMMAVFCLLYVGAENTMGAGWIVTVNTMTRQVVKIIDALIQFAVEERGGGSSAGYISSGFFGGLMLGRIGLLWLNEKASVGERRVVYAYILLAVGLEMTVWMLPNLFGNAIAFALVGVLMGYI
ncbi:MFS general substrate transporter [Rhizoctonia solani]|uniref:MFS general substrate transporter n=1 Tax=Rhizoctonia solani TaxID=456999 RepID=A0A8H7I9B2_9AGAM|nr:MFS general substrate transporter [Rhizoctonia solani]